MENTNTLLLLVAGYIGRDVVPWLGARLVEMAIWCGPRIDRVIDALLRARPARSVNEQPSESKP